MFSPRCVASARGKTGGDVVSKRGWSRRANFPPAEAHSLSPSSRQNKNARLLVVGEVELPLSTKASLAVGAA
jgi:hypothetical protein